MDVLLDRGKEHPHLSIVTKRLRDESGSPIGRRHGNPILDSILYEVEFSYGEKMSLSVNATAENMFAQVDEQGHHHVIMDIVQGQNQVLGENSQIWHQSAKEC